MEKNGNKPDFWPVMRRSAFGCCPCCGEGKLFQGYLKPVVACASCGEKFGHIRAEDGPAWLTIILVGHILAPFFLHVLPKLHWPDWAAILSITLATLMLTLWLLPRCKGMFIGMIWRSGCVGSEP